MKAIRYAIISMFIGSLFMAMCVVVLSKPKTVINLINEERAMVEETMGREALERSIRRTNDLYRTFKPAIIVSLNFLNDDGRINKIDGRSIPNSLHSTRKFYNECIEVFWNLVYQSLQRIFIIIELGWFALLIMIGAGVDGWTVRNIKKTSFGYTSPVFYQLGFIGVSIFFVGVLMLTTVPFAIPFWVYTIWMVIMAFCVRFVTANTQKLF
ncbi:hypothetical protein A3715_15680 [Oleiphilus sp. HI0009]|nr:hypothetical protein A3715_15680 [Oleiphilus sp. HI0009]